jgi:hypothetical protein
MNFVDLMDHTAQYRLPNSLHDTSFLLDPKEYLQSDPYGDRLSNLFDRHEHENDPNFQNKGGFFSTLISPLKRKKKLTPLELRVLERNALVKTITPRKMEKMRLAYDHELTILGYISQYKHHIDTIMFNTIISYRAFVEKYSIFLPLEQRLELSQNHTVQVIVPELKMNHNLDLMAQEDIDKYVALSIGANIDPNLGTNDNNTNINTKNTVLTPHRHITKKQLVTFSSPEWLDDQYFAFPTQYQTELSQKLPILTQEFTSAQFDALINYTITTNWRNEIIPILAQMDSSANLDEINLGRDNNNDFIRVQRQLRQIAHIPTLEDMIEIVQNQKPILQNGNDVFTTLETQPRPESFPKRLNGFDIVVCEIPH